MRGIAPLTVIAGKRRVVAREATIRSAYTLCTYRGEA